MIENFSFDYEDSNLNLTVGLDTEEEFTLSVNGVDFNDLPQAESSGG